MYGETPAAALQVAAFSSESQRSTNPYDGGYAIPSGYGMFTMGGDEDVAANRAGQYDGSIPMNSSNVLYNVPSYYQAGNYGGYSGSSYRVQSSRKEPNNTTTTATKAPKAGSERNRSSTSHHNGSSGETGSLQGARTSADQLYGPARTSETGNVVRHSGSGSFRSGFNYGDSNDPYGGGFAGMSSSGGGLRVGNVALMSRSGATTATSIGDCHLSRKEDGGFTPQSDNTFLDYRGSFDGRSADSRSGDCATLSSLGSAYDPAYNSHNMNQRVSDPTLLSKPQRRLSESLWKEGTQPNTSATTSATAHSGSGSSLSRLSKSDHATPVLAPSVTQRTAPHSAFPLSSPATAAAAAKPATVQRKRSFADAERAQTLMKSGSFHSYSSNFGEAGCSPFYDVEALSYAEKLTPKAPGQAHAATAATAATTIAAANAAATAMVPAPPSSATQGASASPTKTAFGTCRSCPQQNSRNILAAADKKPAAQAMTEIHFLPGVQDKAPAPAPPSSSNAKTEKPPLVSAPKPNSAAPPHCSLREQLDKSFSGKNRRVIVEGVDTASSHSGCSGSKQHHAPPFRYNGTVLPSTFATVSPRAHGTTTATVAKAPIGRTAEPPRTHLSRNSRKPGSARQHTQPPGTVANASSTKRGKVAAQSSPSLEGLPHALKEHPVKAVAAAAPSQLAAFAVAPPPSGTRDPNRFFRRRHLMQPTTSFSATEVVRPAEASSSSPSSSPSQQPSTAKSKGSLNSTSTQMPVRRDIRGNSTASLNVLPMVANNLIGDGQINVNGMKGDGAANANGPQPPVTQQRRRPSISKSIVPQASGAEAAHEPMPASSSSSRHHSGSETYSLNDVASTAQSQSCPSIELLVDEGANGLLQRRSSSWSVHSSACSSDSGDGSHCSASRARRRKDRMLPTVEEEMERLAHSRFGVRL